MIAFELPLLDIELAVPVPDDAIMTLEEPDIDIVVRLGVHASAQDALPPTLSNPPLVLTSHAAIKDADPDALVTDPTEFAPVKQAMTAFA